MINHFLFFSHFLKDFRVREKKKEKKKKERASDKLFGYRLLDTLLFVVYCFYFALKENHHLKTTTIII